MNSLNSLLTACIQNCRIVDLYWFSCGCPFPTIDELDANFNRLDRADVGIENMEVQMETSSLWSSNGYRESSVGSQ
jgi:hypothetical protein